MIKRKFQANIVSDFKRTWLEAVAEDEQMTIKEAEKSYGGVDLDELHDRIAGKQVTMCEWGYAISENDFFEQCDNNFVMYRSCWVEI